MLRFRNILPKNAQNKLLSSWQLQLGYKKEFEGFLETFCYCQSKEVSFSLKTSANSTLSENTSIFQNLQNVLCCKLWNNSYEYPIVFKIISMYDALGKTDTSYLGTHVTLRNLYGSFEYLLQTEIHNFRGRLTSSTTSSSVFGSSAIFDLLSVVIGVFDSASVVIGVCNSSFVR